MPNLPISGLPAGTTIAGTEPFPSVQSPGGVATTVKLLASDVKTYTSNAPTFTGVAAFSAGAAALPSLIPTGDTNTGFWFPAADTIAASTGGSERLRINSSGNVGIGTTSPSARLHVSGGAGLFERSYSGTSPLIQILNSSTSGASALYDTALIQADDVPCLRIVEITGGSSSAEITIAAGDGSAGNVIGSTSSLIFATGRASGTSGYLSTNERMRITSAGNVGIGTTSPSSILNVVSSAACIVRLKGGTSNTQSSAVFFTCAGSGNTLGAIGDRSTINGGAVDQEFQIYAGLDSASTPVPLTVSVGGSERMRINSSGNVGIGTTSPASSLEIYNTGNTTLTISGSSGGGSDVSQIDFYRIGSNVSASVKTVRDGGNASGALTFYTAASGTNSERMRITSVGRVGIGTQNPSATLEINSAATHLILQYASAVTRRSVITSNAGFSAVYNGLIIGSNASDKSVQVDSTVSSWYQELGSYDISGDAWKVLYQAPGAGSASEFMRITNAGNVLIGTTSSPTTGTQCLTIETGTAPTATPADTVTFYSSDLSAGNTMPSFYTEGTIVGTGTPTADRTIAVRINGTVYYLLASTIP